MDAREDHERLLANPECYAVLTCALEDYAGTLKGNVEPFVNEAEAAYFARCDQHVEVLRDVFERWS